MNGKMPGEWSAKESYPWLKQNCSAMEGHVLYTFSNGVEPGDGRAFLQENNVPYLVKPFEVAELISPGPQTAAEGAGGGSGYRLGARSSEAPPMLLDPHRRHLTALHVAGCIATSVAIPLFTHRGTLRKYLETAQHSTGFLDAILR